MKTSHAVLAIVGLVLSVGAVVAGDGAMDVGANRVTSISALELAGLIRDGDTRLRVIDLRDSASYAMFSIPVAELYDVEELVKLDASSNNTFVLYGQDSIVAFNGARAMKAQGAADVRVLNGGMEAWARDVMSATVVSDGSAAAEAELARRKELSEYFGGVVTRTTAAEKRLEKPADAAAQVIRRGCDD